MLRGIYWIGGLVWILVLCIDMEFVYVMVIFLGFMFIFGFDYECVNGFSNLGFLEDLVLWN